MRFTPFPGWRVRYDPHTGIYRHEPKVWARVVKWLTGRYPGEA